MTEEKLNEIAESFKAAFSGSVDFLSGVNEATYSLLREAKAKEFFFDQDESSHWYMIPSSRREEWNKAREMNIDTDAGYDQWCIEGWDNYRTGGGINDIDFSVL